MNKNVSKDFEKALKQYTQAADNLKRALEQFNFARSKLFSYIKEQKDDKQAGSTSGNSVG